MTKQVPCKIDNLYPFVEQAPCFACLDKGMRSTLAEGSEFLRFEAGKEIFAEGGPANGGYILSVGRVAMKKQTFRGRAMFAELLGPNDCFGVVSAAQGRPYPMTAQALRESVVFKIDQNLLESLAREHSEFLRHLLNICTERLQAAHTLIAHLADASSEIRIASALLLAAHKFGIQANGFARVDLTRDEISSIAGTTVETCIRVTRAFEGRGLVSLPAPRKIDILDPDALHKLCARVEESALDR